MKAIKSDGSKEASYLCRLFLISCFSLTFLSFESSAPQDVVLARQEKEKLQANQEGESSEISDWEARLELARVLSYLKRYDESVQEYQRLLQTHPEAVEARIEMAKVFFYQNKANEALAEFSKIPYQQIDDATWVIIADIYRQKKQYQDAEHIYSQYLKKKPEDDKVRLKLAELLSWQKRYDESIHHYQIILSHRPHDIQVRRRYAQVLTWMGQDEEAVEEWRKTLK
jgi:tetratricopeptide (TPR) repeat protein